MNKHAVYALILFVAAGEVATIAYHADRLAQAPAWFWVLAGAAVFRLARSVSFNAIGAPIRARWTVVEPDGSGAGDTVNPRKMADGSDHPLGELLACPICTGTHAAGLILTVYGLAPAVGLAVVALFGLAGVSEILHWTACLVEWRGNAAREETGEYVRDRERSKPTRWREIAANGKQERARL